MGKQIYLEAIKRLFEKSPVVNFQSIEKIIRDMGGKYNYAKLLVSHLLKGGKIKKVGKGVYTAHIESSLAVFAFKPAYLGLQSALCYLGLWEQETIPVIITTKKVRCGIRAVIGSNILIRTIDKRYLFGFDFVKDGNFYLPYSDLEKTCIDMVIFNEYMDDSILHAIKKKINHKKLQKYLKKYPQRLHERVEKKLLG